MSIALYIHIPFCKSRCTYCSFTTGANTNQFDEYTNCLIKEILSYKREDISTIFFGGGTPSFLPRENLEKIISSIHEHHNTTNLKEFTIETNPEDASSALFDMYKRQKVTRVSFGVQSLNDDILKNINRRHNSKKAIDAINLAKQYNFDVNADLIIGLANYDQQQIIEDAKTLSKLVDHLSIYMLSIEEGTKLFTQVKNKEFEMFDDDYLVNTYLEIVKTLKDNNFSRYEVSNFCKNKKECLHNIAYWTQSEYIGCGIAAHSLYNNTRYSNTCDINEYIFNINNNIYKRQNEEKLDGYDSLYDHLIVSLRMDRGINLDELYKKHEKIHVDKIVKIINDNKIYFNIDETLHNISIKEQYFCVMNQILILF